MPTEEEILQRAMSITKHMDGRTFAGIATFFRADWAETFEGVDIGLVGVPIDCGLTQRSGARHGPREIRNQSGHMFYYNPLTRMTPYDFARIADLGDVPFESLFNLDKVIAELHAYYVTLHAAGIVPISAGGDHSISYPIIKALGADRPVGLIHLDAHLDCTGQIGDSLYHHGSPFKNAVDDGAMDPKRSIHIGIRDQALEFEAFAETSGMTTIDIDRFYDLGIAGVIAETRRVVGDGPVYISVDVDALDPAFAPGTGTPVVGGMTSYELKRILHGLRGLDVIGADVVEVSPPFDSSGITALAGAQIMFELLCLAAEAFKARRERGG